MKTEGLTMNQLAELNANYVTTISKLEQKLTDMAVQLANSESKSRELAGVVAENTDLKSLIEQHAASIAVCPNCSHEEPSETDDIVALYRSLKTPATDAFLAEVRASVRNEGINYAASRLAAAFNHGFLDKPVAEVLDVTRMILSAKEDLANDSLPAADGLSGEYAEKAIEAWAAKLSEGGEA
ncbi:hypothetical protein CTR21_003734 [Salmonella enterica subsp. diarizonae]|nr:hypothetical protein [Salmonella enterica subsp. diarizonae]